MFFSYKNVLLCPRLDTYTSGFAGYAKVTYNVLHDTISIKDLALDVFFEELEVFLYYIQYSLNFVYRLFNLFA